MAELKPIKVEVERVKPTFRPAHFLAGFMWLNFAGLIWVTLLDLMPEPVTGGVVGSAAVVFFLLAIGASMVGYEKGEK